MFELCLRADRLEEGLSVILGKDDSLKQATENDTLIL